MRKMKVDFDYEYDNLFFFYLNNENYEYSEFLEDSVSVDFNTEMVPMAIEISEDSKKFKVKKQHLKYINDGEIKILINEGHIKLSIELYVEIHNKATLVEPINVIGDNDFNIPNFKTSIAIV